MKKILIVPDVHHKVTRVEQILLKETPDQVIFLGDWFDDFDDDTIISEQTALWLARRMDRHPEDIFLWGNHDTHYGFPSRETRCSGFTEAKMITIRDIMTSKHWDRFKFVYWVDNWLFSHAGLTAPHASGVAAENLKSWLESEEEKAQLRLRQSKRYWMYEAGMSRHGRAPFGGVNWCDTSEFLPIANINQVFGHTPQPCPWKYDTNRRNGQTPNSHNYCIDTHLWNYGVFVDGKFSIEETPVFKEIQQPNGGSSSTG